MRDPKSSAVFDLSVVVIGRNEGDRLITCLRSVQAMRGDFERAEIIYVDSASADRSPERARELGAKVIVLEAGDLSAAKARKLDPVPIKAASSTAAGRALAAGSAKAMASGMLA